jgi:hypothetical protein
VDIKPSTISTWIGIEQNAHHCILVFRNLRVTNEETRGEQR